MLGTDRVGNGGNAFAFNWVSGRKQAPGDTQMTKPHTVGIGMPTQHPLPGDRKASIRLHGYQHMEGTGQPKSEGYCWKATRGSQLQLD